MADNKFTSTENMNGAPSAHDRAHSLIDFQGTTLGMAAKGMRNELHNLVNTAPEADREHFAKEMDSFFDLFGRYLTEKAKGQK
ncbi:UTP-glucose-1-phosphate uridylyltransferase, partial [Rhizoclosmatium hyalinum]